MASGELLENIWQGSDELDLPFLGIILVAV